MRGGIVDVFPSTAELPVRIDLWGDEVDRLTEFDPGDQRSLDALAEVEVFGCREVLPTEAVRARASALVGTEPWGRSQWERLADGQLFDGMESWLPWLVDDERVLADLIGPGGAGGAGRPPPGARPGRRAGRRGGRPGRVASPSRGASAARDGDGVPTPARCRAPGAPAVPIGTAPDGSPACTCPSTGCWPPRRPRGVDGAGGRCARHPGRRRRGLSSPCSGTGPGWRPGCRELVGAGYSVTVCAEGAGSAGRLAAVLGEEGLIVPPVARRRRRSSTARACGWWWRRSNGASSCPSAKVAVLAEADVTGRRRSHRAGPGPGPSDRRLLRRPGRGRLRRAPPARGRPLRAAW